MTHKSHEVIDFAGLMFTHDAWGTEELLRFASQLSYEQCTRQFAIGPGSVVATLDHIISAMERWLTRIGCTDDVSYMGYVEPVTPADSVDFDQLSARLEAVSKDLQRLYQCIATESRLSEMMGVQMAGYDEVFYMTRGTAFAHVVTHGCHHRAQILNMLRQMNLPIALPELDAVECELMLRRSQED